MQKDNDDMKYTLMIHQKKRREHVYLYIHQMDVKYLDLWIINRKGMAYNQSNECIISS